MIPSPPCVVIGQLCSRSKQTCLISFHHKVNPICLNRLKIRRLETDTPFHIHLIDTASFKTKINTLHVCSNAKNLYLCSFICGNSHIHSYKNIDVGWLSFYILLY